MEVVTAPTPLTIDTNGSGQRATASISVNGKRRLEIDGDGDDTVAPSSSRVGCSHMPSHDGDEWLQMQLHATLRRARYASNPSTVVWDADESSSLRCERAVCLSCDFSGRREDAHDAAQCFLTHAIRTNHHFALLPRKKQLFCARCLDFVYPDAVLALTQLTTPSHHPPHHHRNVNPLAARRLHHHHHHPHSHSHPPCAPSLRRRLMRSSARRGLVNMGNTCFMNAVLQTLAHNPLVQHEYFVVRSHNTTICEQKRRLAAQHQSVADSLVAVAPCMGCEMSSLLQTLFPAPRATLTARHLTSPVVPQSFLETFWASAPSFVGSQQQDAHEFLVTLLNGIHKHTCPRAPVATTAPPDVSPASPRFSPTGQSLCDCVVHHNFAGVFSSEISCVFCDTVSSKYDPFLDITLSVDTPTATPRKANNSRTNNDTSPPPPAPLSLVSLLEQFTVEERLKGANQVYCRRCSRYVDAMKRLVLHKLPNLLVLHLGRFDFVKKRKITDTVTFPLRGLDLREFCSDVDINVSQAVATPSQNRHRNRLDTVAAEGSNGRNSPMTPPLTPHTRDAMYDLAAVVSHHGDSVDGGHFTTFVHSAQDHDAVAVAAGDGRDVAATAAASSWLHFDDAKVERVSTQRVEESQAYLLLYVRRRLFV